MGDRPHRGDEALRRLALERLGPHAPALAREALERGSLEVEPGVLQWQGSLGTVNAHKVKLSLEVELLARVRPVPSVVDALTAAVAAAVATGSGEALADLELGPLGSPVVRDRSPYRD